MAGGLLPLERVALAQIQSGMTTLLALGHETIEAFARGEYVASILVTSLDKGGASRINERIELPGVDG